MPHNRQYYQQINRQVMLDTQRCYENHPKLIAAVNHSIQKQYMVAEEEPVTTPAKSGITTNYLISGKRSFEAAKGYPGQKVAVLNFANNHSVGGAPFVAGAQEESLCRCSTLYPCLLAMFKPFYEKHQRAFEIGLLSFMGNDDLIYTPDVIVFKTDERTDPIQPVMIPENDWYSVNVITCAAPILKKYSPPQDYEQVITRRIKRILDVAANEQNEVLILGAWGCGDYRNPSNVVARIFCSLLPNYSFETVEFAMASDTNLTASPFYQEVVALKERCGGSETDNAHRFNSIMRRIGRPGTEQLLSQLASNNFYVAPASVRYHNNIEGGLLKHSLEVYDAAMENRKQMLEEDPGLASELNEDSVAVAALLHDVCKADEYLFVNGTAVAVQPVFPLGGHGDKSVIRVLMWGYELKPEEILAIKWHMGAQRLTDRNAIANCQRARENALCRLIIHADHQATH